VISATEARRTALILASAQAIVGSAAPIVFSLGALAGHFLLDADKSLATAPITAFTGGVALGAVPAAMLIRRMGQRGGFLLGTAVTAAGGVVTTLGLYRLDFWLFVVGCLVIGLGGAFVQQFRFAAADNAPPAFKARAISFVLAGGIVTAVLGPQVVIFTRDMLAPVQFAGAFVSILGLAAAGALVLAFLPKAGPAAGGGPQHVEPARTLGAIVGNPRFVVGLLCAVGSYALMNFVMTGAPLAMVGCGFTPDDATLGISWHVMAMFGPSFFTGRLIHRFGVETIVATGLLLLMGCAAVALSGIALWQFWTALILLGLGWNFAFIGATAIVAETYRPSEKGKVLGLHDFILFSAVAVASLMSGRIYNDFGWEALNWVVFPVSAVCLVALAMLWMTSRKPKVA
jgi:MFS family permease